MEEEVKTRRPPLKGKCLFPLINENPRRKNSKGFMSLQIIMNNPGITYEEFRERGGRPNDAHWDIDRERVRVE